MNRLDEPTWIVYNTFGEISAIFHSLTDLMRHLRGLDPKDRFFVYKYGYGAVTYLNAPQELHVRELLG